MTDAAASKPSLTRARSARASSSFGKRKLCPSSSARASGPGVPVWYHQGGICTGETYKSVVKLTFFKGASLEDPSGLFNSSLGGNTRRAIDFHEDDEFDEQAFVTLIRAPSA